MPQKVLDKLPGMRLSDAEALLKGQGIAFECEEYIAPKRQRHGEDYRVIQARSVNGCAKLVYAGFNTDTGGNNQGE